MTATLFAEMATVLSEVDMVGAGSLVSRLWRLELWPLFLFVSAIEVWHLGAFA